MKNPILTAVLLSAITIIDAGKIPAQQVESVAVSRPETLPRSGFSASFAEGCHATGWIPIDLELGAYVYVRGRVNGVETDVVLDTGAGATVVDQGFADQLGLDARGSVMAKGVGGMQRAKFLAGITVEVPGVTMRIPSVVGIDMSGVAARLGRAMPVILGKDVFQSLVVDVDYPRARVAFSAPAAFSYDGPGRTVPIFDAGQGHRLVELRIEGLGPAKFRLDTGSGAAIDLFKAYVDEHKLLDGRAPVSTRPLGGVGGTLVSKVATLKSVTFAGYELRAVPAGFTQDDNGGAFADETIAGNLGAGFFSRFRMILDYSRSRLHVEPAEGWQSQPFRKDRIGIGGIFEASAIRVTHVAEGSPAEKQGWKLGQRITAVDGKPVASASWRNDMAKWTRAAAGTEVSLTDGEGVVRKLVAADYY